MTELLFDTPWWLPALILAVGVFLFITGNKRLERKVRNAGVGVILLAIGLAAVSYLVDTPRETAIRRTRELVYAFERADFPAMSAILDPSATVTVLNSQVYSNRAEIIANAEKAHTRYGFRTARVLSTNAEQVDTLITVTTVLLTEQNIPNTLNSTWQFEWQRTATGWALVEVRALQIGQQTGDQVRGMFPSK